MENRKRISDSTLLMIMMGLPQKRVKLDDSDVQRHEMQWAKRYPHGFEIMTELVVTRKTISEAGFIEDEGYLRPEDGEYDYEIEMHTEDVSLYLDNMPLCTDDQIENIVIPQLKNLIKLW